MDETIIRLSNSDHFRTTSWKMMIDLKELVGSAGKRIPDKYNGGTMVSYPLPRAKKLLRLIRDFGTEEDFQKCDRVLAKHEKLKKYWEALR